MSQPARTPANRTMTASSTNVLLFKIRLACRCFCHVLFRELEELSVIIEM
jgi:hypothetical protein